MTRYLIFNKKTSRYCTNHKWITVDGEDKVVLLFQGREQLKANFFGSLKTALHYIDNDFEKDRENLEIISVSIIDKTVNLN